MSSAFKTVIIANTVFCDHALHLPRRSDRHRDQRRNAPRQGLLRPAIRLTSAEASACRRAINLRRSVLGAIRTLRVDRAASSERQRDFPLFAIFSFKAHIFASRALCSISKGPRFAEPGALSSTSPIDLPLPRTAPRESFVLLASRARRSGNLRSARDRRKGIRREKGRKLRSSRLLCSGRTSSSPARARASGGRSRSGPRVTARR